MRKPMTRLLCAAVGVGCMIAASVQGAAYTWLNATSDNWSTATAWTPNGDPSTTADTVLVNVTGAPYTVTVNAARTIGSLTLNSANATLDASSTLQFSAASGTAAFNSGTLKALLRSMRIW